MRITKVGLKNNYKRVTNSVVVVVVVIIIIIIIIIVDGRKSVL